MDGAALSVEQLDALSRAVPDDTERRDIQLYLQVLPATTPYEPLSSSIHLILTSPGTSWAQSTLKRALFLLQRVTSLNLPPSTAHRLLQGACDMQAESRMDALSHVHAVL